MEMWGFPSDWQQGEVGGAIVTGEGAVPSATGTAVFLNANPDLQVVLDRVEGAGGKILMPKTAIGMENAGHFAMIADTEGNTVGLHSRADAGAREPAARVDEWPKLPHRLLGYRLRP